MFVFAFKAKNCSNDCKKFFYKYIENAMMKTVRYINNTFKSYR